MEPKYYPGESVYVKIHKTFHHGVVSFDCIDTTSGLRVYNIDLLYRFSPGSISHHESNKNDKHFLDIKEGKTVMATDFYVFPYGTATEVLFGEK